MWHFGPCRADKRIRELEERFEKIEREVKSALLDYDELYDKARHLMGRVEKRVAAAAGQLELEATRATADGGIPPGPNLEGTDPVSARILARRRSHGVLPSTG